MKSRFDELNDIIPEGITDREDLIEWVLDNGIYLHEDTKIIPLNCLCNHVDGLIMDFSKEMSGHAAHKGWYKIAALNKIFGLISEARGIQGGFEFKIKMPIKEQN